MGAAPQLLRTVIEAAIAGTGADLEDVTVTRAGRRDLVRVVLDRDGGIDLDTVADLSRRIGDALDAPEAAGTLPGAYVLEVTSPGVDRPLTQPRHWRRGATRLVQVDLAGGEQVTGRILRSDDAAAVLDVDGAERELRYDAIDRAVIQVEFNRSDVDDDTVEADETIDSEDGA